MLFNSYIFLFAFLPAALAGWFWLGKLNARVAIVWLALLSILFYGSWNIAYIPLLLGSIAFNYLAGRLIADARHLNLDTRAGQFLATAICGNLALLGYYKYAGFFVLTAAKLSGISLAIPSILLPIGISFFTFTQIAFLVDVRRGLVNDFDPLRYLLFVTYFPHLIAGPVIHHADMMPQFAQRTVTRVNWANMAPGATIFAIGMIKKVILADSFADYANEAFNAAAAGTQLSFWEAWGGTLAYALQLYFDFSGYSDMAVGVSRLFNINLPENFNAPYKSANISEFWRCWHMTLSRFLRDYLYVPLGGNRKGNLRRYLNLFATMLLGGLWHGSAWTFVIWGGLHGIYLCIHHAWVAMLKKIGIDTGSLGKTYRLAAILLTFISVCVAWVFFRATSIISATDMLIAMFGGNGISLPETLAKLLQSGATNLVDPVAVGLFPNLHWLPVDTTLIIGLGLILVWCMPTTREIVSGKDQQGATAKSPAIWQPTPKNALMIGIVFLYALLSLDRVSPFLYYQF